MESDIPYEPVKGRPTDYSEELANRFCERIADGESTVKICRDDDMPSRRTIFTWLDKYEDFSHKYAKAKEMAVENLMDELIEIADDSSNDTYEDEKGNIKTDTEVVSRSRLRVDTRKWVIMKLAPKKYGDKTDAAADTTLTIVNALQI
jgi:hypothetical protein